MVLVENGSWVRAGAVTVSLFGAAGLSLLGGASGCGPAATVAVSKPAAKPAGKPFDPCEGAQPLGKKYTGILKNARCDQEMYLTMAAVAEDLGVECKYCHVNDHSGDPKKFDFPVMTDHKQVALFMQREFMDGLTVKDGKAARCGNCHLDKNGKPKAKFLGEPRDVEFAVEWMNTVMTNRFTHTDGGKVKCKDCHVGNFGTPEFKKEVVMHADQIKLPGITPFERVPDVSAPAPGPLVPGQKPPVAPVLPKKQSLLGEETDWDRVAEDFSAEHPDYRAAD